MGSGAADAMALPYLYPTQIGSANFGFPVESTIPVMPCKSTEFSAILQNDKFSQSLQLEASGGQCHIRTRLNPACLSGRQSRR
jgi:hypothetical protein